MALNCKAGDLAVIVSAGAVEFCGWIVKCLEPVTDQFTKTPGWVVEPPIPGYRGVADAILRPIRDPGDDAQDETLLWKPVPASNPKTPEPV